MKIDANERLTAERGQLIADSNEYTHYTVLPNGRDACICKFAFTYAILADITEWGYGDRWCYETRGKAIHGLGEWMQRDGEGEPEGWHRHVDSGRRRPDGDASKEYINF
jgi:hypothetical protein